MPPGLQGESSLPLGSRGPGVTLRAAVVQLCKLWAFTLPDRGCLLSMLSCQGHNSRSGEAYVVRELGRKFSCPDAPPFLPVPPPTGELGGNLVGGAGGGGGTGGGERGVFALTLAVSLWHSVDSLPGLQWDVTGLPGGDLCWFQVSWVFSHSSFAHQIWLDVRVMLGVPVSPVLPQPAAAHQLPAVLWGVGQQICEGKSFPTLGKRRESGRMGSK